MENGTNMLKAKGIWNGSQGILKRLLVSNKKNERGKCGVEKIDKDI